MSTNKPMANIQYWTDASQIVVSSSYRLFRISSIPYIKFHNLIIYILYTILHIILWLPDSPLREVKEKNKNRIKNSLNAIGIFIVTLLESITHIHFTDTSFVRSLFTSLSQISSSCHFSINFSECQRTDR